MEKSGRSRISVGLAMFCWTIGSGLVLRICVFTTTKERDMPGRFFVFIWSQGQGFPAGLQSGSKGIVRRKGYSRFHFILFVGLLYVINVLNHLVIRIVVGFVHFLILFLDR
jgi:hypothetical protein